MMNKNDYIRQVDGIKAPEELKKKISAVEAAPNKKKKGRWKAAVAVAACLVVICAAILPGISGATKEYGSLVNEGTDRNNSMTDSSSTGTGIGGMDMEAATGTTAQSQRKIVKKAWISIKTKDMDAFISTLDKKLAGLEGYVESFQDSNGDLAHSASMKLRVPADRLDGLLNALDSIATVTSKSVTNSDITGEYIDTESKIAALETEEKALLNLLEKAENLENVISLHDRLAQVRSDLDSMKSQKKLYDSEVSYSTVEIDVEETERVYKNDGSFASELKEKFIDSLYNLGAFFRSAALNLLGSAPYLALVAVVAAVVIIIIKKRNSKK